MGRKSLIEDLTFGQRAEGSKVLAMQIMPQAEARQGQKLEVETCLACLRNSKKANVIRGHEQGQE